MLEGGPPRALQVKLHQTSRMGWPQPPHVPLPCPGPPWSDSQSALERSMHTGELSPAVPKAGQSSGGDQTLIWESSSPAYPSWSSLAISQAKPVRPSIHCIHPPSAHG